MTGSLPRRKFMRLASLAGIMTALPILPVNPGAFAPKRKVAIFSKHLQWLPFDEMAAFVAACGFDGVDLTVRKGGHVEPEKVEVDLPKAVTVIRNAGKEVPLLTTGIVSALDPCTERILSTASSLGIPCYRMGWYGYDPDKEIVESLLLFEDQLRELEVLNKKYSIRGAYQNHAGRSLGSPVWDIGKIVHNINSPWLGIQYDIRHATVEGGHSWPLGFEYVKPFINSLDVKDVYWSQTDGNWSAVNTPLGEGMVDFEDYFARIRLLDPSIPISLHLEYPLGGAENGSKKVSVGPDIIRKAMTADLKYVESFL